MKPSRTKRPFISYIAAYISQFKGGENVPIQSYFYDSINGDRPYSASDFARAFGMIMNNGVVADINGNLGFALSGTDNRTVNQGRATVQGHFVEVTGTETLTVPGGSYNGQIVIRVDITSERRATLVVKTDRNPSQSSSLFELPLYNIVVSNGAIGTVTDLRTQGGALARTAANVVTWEASTSGVRMRTGLYNGTGKPIILYLTANRPAASASEHRVWIQIENF
jgi:hypothetical protein